MRWLANLPVWTQRCIFASIGVGLTIIEFALGFHFIWRDLILISYFVVGYIFGLRER